MAKPAKPDAPTGAAWMREHVRSLRQTVPAFFRGTRTVQRKPVPSVLNWFLQGIAERPLPCNYYVIDFVSALSRR